MPHNAWHTRLQEAIQAAGFFAWIWDATDGTTRVHCVPERHSDGVYTGTSLYVEFEECQRVLGSFGYQQWEIPPEVNLEELVLACLRSGAGASSVTDEIIERFELVERDLD